VSSYQE